jgi:hypothetical protein
MIKLYAILMGRNTFFYAQNKHRYSDLETQMRTTLFATWRTNL